MSVNGEGGEIVPGEVVTHGEAQFGIPIGPPPGRGSFTLCLGGATDGSQRPGFRLDGDTAEATFFGGADPHDPEFWRAVYALPGMEPSAYGSPMCFLTTKLVEVIYRHGGRP